ncbi:MAG: DUF6505 family protein [Magnetovibrionaceae bacterium]
MKFPRTIRMDLSDENVFAKAADPGEWAVTGSFAFADLNPDLIKGKTAQAFRNGWLGLGSFGFSTLVQVATMEAQDWDAVVGALSSHFVEVYGAPSLEAARPVAEAEAAYARDLCDHPSGTLLAIRREMTLEGISEKIHVIDQAEDSLHHGSRVWELVPDDAPA